MIWVLKPPASPRSPVTKRMPIFDSGSRCSSRDTLAAAPWDASETSRAILRIAWA